MLSTPFTARIWFNGAMSLHLSPKKIATTGSAQGGIFAYSLALSPTVGNFGIYVLLPAEWHEPLRQRMVLIKGASEEASAFYAYVQQPAARTILRHYGFLLPD